MFIAKTIKKSVLMAILCGSFFSFSGEFFRPSVFDCKTQQDKEATLLFQKVENETGYLEVMGHYMIDLTETQIDSMVTGIKESQVVTFGQLNGHRVGFDESLNFNLSFNQDKNKVFGVSFDGSEQSMELKSCKSQD